MADGFRPVREHYAQKGPRTATLAGSELLVERTPRWGCQVVHWHSELASLWPLDRDEGGADLMADSGVRASDKVRVHNTRSRVLDAAQGLVDEAADNGKFLEAPTRTVLAERAGLHPQTVRKHFEDWSAVCAALCERYRRRGLNPPENVRAWAQPYFDKEATGQAVPVASGLDELRDRYAAASTGNDDTALAQAAKALVDKLSGKSTGVAAHAGEIIECARTVRSRVSAASAKPALEAALALSDAAVEAHRHLAWGPGGSGNSASDQTRLLLKAGDHGRAGDAAARARQMVDQALNEPQQLQAIVQIKRWDKEISNRLGLRVRAVLAQFHIDRAEALILRRPEDEIASLARAVTDLRAIHRGERPEQPEPADVAMLVARFAGVCLAYPELLQNGELDLARVELLRLFKRNTHESRQLHRDAQSLFNLIDEKPVDAIELLRALRFRGPGDFLIARHLAAQAEMSNEHIEYRFGRKLGAPDGVRIMLLTRAESCYRRVVATSRISGCAGALAGIAEAEMEIAARKIDQLRHAGAHIPPTPTNDQTIEHLLRSIDDLVHRAVMGDALDPRQVARLVNALDPIRTFLMGSEVHRLSVS
ncbi:hypothetical protein ACIA5H_34795 [Nocardia sp. NPDC051900]|uniref:hypothetical protein n=1 Tax=Nocardia sp. NPDC051900 TaxID=3364326 RepID=UPI00379C892F